MSEDTERFKAHKVSICTRSNFFKKPEHTSLVPFKEKRTKKHKIPKKSYKIKHKKKHINKSNMPGEPSNSDLQATLLAAISGLGQNVAGLEQKVDSVVGTVQNLSRQCVQQKESMASMQEKFEKLETELRETREEVGALKAQAPPRLSEVVGRSRREETLTGANLQQQEP